MVVIQSSAGMSIDGLISLLERSYHLHSTLASSAASQAATGIRAPDIRPADYMAEMRNITSKLTPYAGTVAFASALGSAAYRLGLKREQADNLAYLSSNGISRRALIGLLSGTTAGLSLSRCRGNNPNPIAPDQQPNPDPQPQNPVEFENSIVSLLPSSNPINGTIYIPRGNENLEFSIANNKVRVARDKNLLPGIYSGSRITASGYHERILDLIVGEAGFSTDLKDGRIETPINLIPSTINLDDFGSWCIRDSRFGPHLQRLRNILKIGILDDGVYEIRQDGVIVRVADYKPVQSTIDALMDVLKKDPSIYTAGLYPNEQGQVPSYVRIKSRGDFVPNDKFTTDGWILIHPESGLPPGWAIGRSDSATDLITWAHMGFRPDIRIPRSGWSTDLRECFGYRERTFEGFDSRGNPLPFFNNYAVIRENRPPGPFSG